MKIRYFAVLCMVVLWSELSAKIELPKIFTSNMVLQQQVNAPIWGQANPGKDVKLVTSWDKQVYSALAGTDGKWRVDVKTPKAGGPYNISIVQGKEKLLLQNILIGEVWICSGQSNMEMPLAGWGKIADYENEIAAADHPNIRLFQMEKATTLSPVTSLKVMGNSWLVCSPTTIPEFSATAYFFAKNLSEKLNGIPVGLIHTSWGGTPAEAWTSKESLDLLPDFKDYIAELKKVPTDLVEQQKYIDQQQNNWKAQLISKDRGYSKGAAAWAQPGCDDAGWKTMNVPQIWEAQMLKDFNGVVWLRKSVDMPSAYAGKDLVLSLGTIDDNEITFFNGQQIGAAEGYNQMRTYTVPGKLVKAGKNVITVRVFDSGGEGGFYGDPQKVFIALGENKLELSGSWKYSVGLDMNEVAIPKIMVNQVQPTTLFNAMINPLVPYAIKGAIWYQGEANVDRAKQYQRLFPLMIHDWRKQWNADFPFYFVQLANYLKRDENPVTSPWAELREAQQQALSLTNTGMATTIDIGNGGDIHPKNKQEVGRRLALLAAENAYGQKIVSCGPVYDSFKIDGAKMIVKFTSIGGGLKSRDGKTLTGFAIAGVDKKFYWANAEIVGDKIIVSCPAVEFPVAVRYGWSNNPDCNLYNMDDLPASPFRTDDWNN